MNDDHLRLLSSSAWRDYLEVDLLPWVLAELDVDGDILEVGPGPGLMTDLLRLRVRHLVAIEVDPVLALSLEERLKGTGVEVVCEDATRSQLPDACFSGAVCLTMLHHVPSEDLQDQLFAELHRLLCPGGRLVGTDSTDSPALRAFHVGDVFVPVDPATLGHRLEVAGFRDAVVEIWEASTRLGPKVRFTATKSTAVSIPVHR